MVLTQYRYVTKWTTQRRVLRQAQSLDGSCCRKLYSTIGFANGSPRLNVSELIQDIYFRRWRRGQLRQTAICGDFSAKALNACLKFSLGVLVLEATNPRHK